MADTNKNLTCGSASFDLTPESSQQLNRYLDVFPKVDVIPRKLITTCSKIPCTLTAYLEQDIDFLYRIFKGTSFCTAYDSQLDTMLQCDPSPNVIVIPVNSIYGNRMFLCNSNSDWFGFLAQFCLVADGSGINHITMKAITSLPDHILERLKAKAQLFDFTAIKLDTDELVQSLFGHLSAILNGQFFSTAVLTAKAFGTLLQMLAVARDPSGINITSLIYNVLIACSVPFMVIQSAVMFLTPYFTTISQCLFPQAQNDDETCLDWLPLCKAIVMTSMTVLSLIAGSKLPEKSSINSSIRFAATLSRSITGVASVASFISEYFMKIFDWTYELVMGVPRDLASLESFEKEVQDYIHRVNKICTDHGDSMNSLRDDPQKIRYCLDTRIIGNNLYERLIRSKISPKGMRVFDRYFVKLEKIIEKAELYGGHGTGARPEPLVIQIFGSSGCGKSHVPYFIAADVCAWEGLEGSPVDYMYYRRRDQDFTDGYKPGKHVIWVDDDFGQVKDTVANPNKGFLEVIYACNIAEWALHMATLQEKSCTYFNSKMVILTSNHLRYNIQSLTEPEAFVRRVDLRFEISIDDKYKNSVGGIDPRKVEALHPGCEVSEHVYKFIPYMRTAGTGNDSRFAPVQDSKSFTPIKLTYDQMINLVHKKYDDKLGHSKLRIDAMERRFQNLIAKKDVFVDAVSDMNASVTPPPSVSSPVLPPMSVPPPSLNVPPPTLPPFAVPPPLSIPQVPIPQVRKRTTLPRAQVCLSAVEELLVCWWARFGYPSDLFDESVQDPGVVSAVNKLRMSVDNVWDFLDEGNQYALVVKPYKDKKDKIDELVNCVSQAVHDSLDYKMTCYEIEDATTIVHPIREYMDNLTVGNVLEGVWQNLKYLIGIVTASLALYKVWKWVRAPDAASGNTIVVEGNASGDARTNARPVIRVEGSVSEGNPSGDVVTNARPAIRVEGMSDIPKSEAYIDCNTQEIISNNIVTNMYRIGGCDANFSANIIFVQGRMALCNWHVWDFLKQFKDVKISNSDLYSGYEIPYKDIEMKEILIRGEEKCFKDLVLLKFPKIVHMHKNLVKHFVRAQDLSRFSKVPGILAGYMPGRGKMLYRVEPLREIKSQDLLQYLYTQPGSNDKYELHVRKAYNYYSQTSAGDCGSVLLINSTTIPRKICGVHVAGDIGYGYATSVTEDDITRAIAAFDAEPVDFELHASVNLDAPLAQVREMMPQGEFVPLGICCDNMGSPGKSDIRHSPIHNSVEGHESWHLPSALKPFVVDGERVDPMMKGLLKCGVPPTYIPQNLVEMAKNDFLPILFANTEEEYQRVLSYEEAITGNDLEFMNPMNRRSSPGYGWSKKNNGMIGKTKWLGDDKYILDDPDLKKSVLEREELARKGVRAPHLWVDTLKVERRPIEKVKAGKTRVFSVGQMDYCLLFRKYFLGFNGHVMNNRIENEIAVGINAYSIDWTRLANHLNKHGEHCVAGDFANYDGTLNPQIMHACLDLINEWYDDGDENALIRKVLFEDVVSSVHICGTLVYQWTHSQPSGNPLTTILNSMYNSISMRIVYILLMREVKSFRNNVSMISYGDDNVVNISEEIVDCFNQFTISEGYSKIGMTYTDESKGKNEIVRTRNICEIEFLKRSFRLVKGRYDAPLSLPTILEMVYWVRGDLEHQELCVTNCETAFFELAMYDKVVFDLWSKRIARACRAKNMYPTLHAYAAMRDMLFFGCVGNNRGYVVNDMNMNDNTQFLCGSAPKLPSAQVLDNSNSSTMDPVTQLVEPVDPVAKNDARQVTQWVDDAAVQEASLPNPVVPGKDILAPGLESREHNIIDVLERPVRIGSFDWNDGQSPDNDIAIYNFPDDIISNAPNVADKIAHFTFLRAHIVVRFVVNANTFQAGRLVAYFAPFSTSADIGDRVNVNNFMSSKTVFPRIVLDAGSGNIGELTIPYVSYYTHYDLARGLGDLGTVRVSVLNPLQSGNATVSVFANFKCISLQIPTAAPNALGSFAGVISDLKRYVLGNPDCKKKCFRQKFRDLLSAATENETTSHSDMVSAAPGRYRRHLMDLPDRSDYWNLPRAQVGEAEIKARTGVVSAPLSLVGKLASMGTSLPVIGNYLNPISWIANAAASVAAVFGLSKSTNLQPLDKFVSIPAYGFTNADGVDNSLVLGTSVENEIGTRFDVFGSDLDEMDIAFVCKHESYLTSFDWSSTSIPTTVLYKAQVSPGAMAYTVVDGAPIFQSTALGYVASMFRYWRGSLKFKVQVTKTAYHSGRLRVAFVPSGGLTSDSYDFNQGYSEIVDLRTSDEIEFTIPFVSNTVWKPCELSRFDVEERMECTTGTLFVEVINQLRAPDTVAGVLNCNVWVSGGDDIQFSIPDFNQNVPVFDASPTIKLLDGGDQDDFDKHPEKYVYKMDRTLPVAQVMGQFQDTGFNAAMHNSNEMFESPKTSAVDASASTVGEHVQNLRTLTRRFGTVATGFVGLTRSYRVKSNYFGVPDLASSTSNAVNISPVDYISWLYRFYRGGIRYKVVVDPASIGGPIGVVSDPGVVQVPSAPATSLAIDLQSGSLRNKAGTYTHWIDSLYNRILEFTLPYFSNTHISLLRGTSVTPSVYADRSTAAYIFGNAVTATGTSGDRVQIYKAGADDFSFGWLVGPPRLRRTVPAGTLRRVIANNAAGLTLNGASLDFTGGLFFVEDVEDGQTTNIVFSSRLTIDYEDDSGGGTLEVIGGTVSRAGGVVTLSIPGYTGGVFDPTSTLASFQAYDDFFVITNP